MTSEHRTRANRENARKSTGPKTAGGKSRSRQNALRHGLEALHIHDPLTHEKIKRLVAMICSDDAELVEQDLATTIAECQIAISRIRAARIRTVERMRTIDVTSYVPPGVWEARRQEIAAIGQEWDVARGARTLKTIATTIHAEIKKAIAAANGAANAVEGKRTPRNDVESFLLAISELLAIERYETRALSRRRRAMEAFRFIRGARVNHDNVA
jgi:hypothetical protein